DAPPPRPPGNPRLFLTPPCVALLTTLQAYAMVYIMSRDPIQTVTLPILVEVDRLNEANGRANFLPDNLAEEAAVRVVRREDIKERLRTIFPPKDLPLFLGATQLKQALDAGDDFVLQQASEKVRPWLTDFVALEDWKWKVAGGRIVLNASGMKRHSAFLNYS